MGRKVWVDYLRLLCVLLLFPYHAAMAWNTWGEGNYILFFGDTAASSFVVAVSPWHMPLLFILAGMSMKYSLGRRTYKQYIKERCIRLLLPLLAGIFFVMPVMAYLADCANCGYTGNYFSHCIVFFRKWTDLTGYDGGFGVGHLWFLLYLFVISVGSIVPIFLQKKYIPDFIPTNVNNCRPHSITSERIGNRELKAAIKCVHEYKNAKINVFSMVFWCIAAMSLMPVKLGSKAILTYLLLYLEGYYVFSEEGNMGRLQKYKYGYLAVFLAATIGNVHLFLWSGGEYELLHTAVMYCSGVFGILTFLCFGENLLNRENRVVSFLAQDSFLLYIFHFVWVIVWEIIFYAATEEAFLVISASSLCAFATTLLTIQIIKRIPLLYFLFSGKKDI